MLQIFLRRATALSLCALLCVPVGTLPATDTVAVGTLHCEGTVYLGGETATTESIVYSGDHLRIDEGRATVSFPRGGLLLVERHSDAALLGSPGAFVIRLEKGQLALAVSSPTPVRVETGGLTVSPGGTFPTLSDITLRGDGSMVMAVHRGEISVTKLRRDPVVVTSGQVLTISPKRALAQGQTVGTGAHGKMSLSDKLRTFHIDGLSHDASVVLGIVGIGAAVTAAVVIPIAVKEPQVSPSAP